MKKLILLGAIGMLFSCNSNKTDAAAEITSAGVPSETPYKTYDCLSDYTQDYSKLLSLKEMTAVYPADITTGEEEKMTGVAGKYLYRWPSDRPDMEMDVAGRKIPLRDDNKMGVSLLSFYGEKVKAEDVRALFDNGYRKLSDEELLELREKSERAAGDNARAVEQLYNARKNSNWEEVSGIGDSAWYQWRKKDGGELAVLAGKAKFYIHVKVSEDPAENKEIAKNLAKKVLEKC